MDWLTEAEDGKKIIADGIVPGRQEIIYIKRWHVRLFFQIIGACTHILRLQLTAIALTIFFFSAS